MISKLRYAAIAVALFSYSVVFGEFFLRVIKPAPLLPRYVTAAPYGVRKNVPGARYWQTTSEVRVEVRINENGMRSDRQIFRRKPDGACRIVLYGDSFFMGYEVAQEETFAYLLEASLREAGTPCEVVNLAVSGFGTAEMLVALRADGLLYKPDLVIFQWHRTDPTDNVRSGLFALRDGRLVSAAAEYLPAVAIRDRLMKFRAYRWTIENSHFYAAIREAAAARVKQILLASNLRRRGAHKDVADPASRPRGEGINESLLRQAKADSEAAGARFLVVDIPFAVTRTKFRPSISLLADSLLADVDVVPTADTFRDAAHPNRKIFWESGHGHLSDFGNRLLSETVVNYIRQHALLRRDKADN